MTAFPFTVTFNFSDGSTFETSTVVTETPERAIQIETVNISADPFFAWVLCIDPREIVGAEARIVTDPMPFVPVMQHTVEHGQDIWRGCRSFFVSPSSVLSLQEANE